jgi:GTP pyrophosphokinase
MQQTLEAALAARGAVLPAKGPPEPAPAGDPVVVGPRLSQAMAFAVGAHASQVRKGTAVPYITHVMAVASLVGESGGSENEMIAALLHDAVEDGGGTPVLERIRAEFGEAVAAIVESCTDDDSGGEKAPWLERKRAYLAHLASAPLPALRVSCADKLHNARSIQRDLRDHGPAVWRRFKADREGTLWYYRSLARIFAALVQDEPGLDAGFRSMIRELREAVAGLEG